ncbi:hypothetical protein H7I53_06275 [Mycolicibacterium pulveris]|uniref:Uncharacterized protein n=1 Tax=Mycolicibacterium pulveris TaxID=36813 RepID=A0A7I7UKS9_MYCPV|nr:hypothetical protein [Mycolicibacterium pulveris]MCV6979834.1 hypothetical protein [Mycolicibacterium pulveris]BBY80716.1 hypothetical protein MPUL_18740 [Mycolicibacterium pulveris]
MNLVLGLSMTSSAVRWVLVEGTTGDGDTVDRGACDLAEAVEPADLLTVVLANDFDGPIHAIGVTWTNEAEAAASGVLDALAARGFAHVIAVSEVEAAEELAAGLADIGGYDDLAVYVCEPDAAVVAVVTPGGVTVDRVDATERAPALSPLDEWTPDAVFVLGSAEDLDATMAALAEATEAPVMSAAGADVALARGAALASARAVTAMAPAGPRLPSKVGALASVLAAAVVTFVVSLSVAVGLSLSGGAPSEPARAASATNPVDEPEGAPSPSEKKVSTPAEARKVVAQTIAVAVPPPPAAPVAEPVYEPPEYVAPAPEYPPPAPEAAVEPAPAPAYVPPPPPPAYVPPQQPAYVPPPKPRLRDRIIERIPIINRFHEPEYPYPR